MSAPGQWLLAVEGFGYEKPVDAFWVHVTMPRTGNLKNHGTYFWISAEWRNHFAQIGVIEYWVAGEGEAKFGGWKGFSATTFDISDPANRMTVKVHNFPDEPLNYCDGATFRIGKDDDHWSMSFIPDNRQFLRENVRVVPIQADHIDRMSLVLESFDQMGSGSWNISQYFSQIPIARMIGGRGAEEWPHARVAYEGNKRPPEYLGLYVGRHWYSDTGMGGPSFIQMGHVGEQPHPTEGLW